MARPTREAEAELERLENIAALLSSMDDACAVIDLRFRQAKRRAKGNVYLLAVLEPVGDEMEALQSYIDAGHDLLAAILDNKQNERTLQNNGGK